MNVSSGFGRFPASMNTVYSATKVYSDFFSRALQHEYSDKGIIVQVNMTELIALRTVYTLIRIPAIYLFLCLKSITKLSGGMSLYILCNPSFSGEE